MVRDMPEIFDHPGVVTQRVSRKANGTVVHTIYAAASLTQYCRFFENALIEKSFMERKGPASYTIKGDAKGNIVIRFKPPAAKAKIGG